MGMLVRQETGDNTSGEVLIIDLDDGEVAEILDGTGVVAQSFAIGGVATFDLPGILPLVGVRIRITNSDNETTAETIQVDINGGDHWIYTYGIDLKVAGIAYSPGDVISVSRMSSGLKEVRVEVSNPNMLPLYDIVLSLRQYDDEWGLSWVWLALDNDGEPGAYDKVINIPQLSSGQVWEGWLVIQRDGADLPEVPGELARLYLDLSANPMLSVGETRTFDFTNSALYEFGEDDVTFSSGPACCDIDGKCAVVKSTGGATIDTGEYAGVKYVRPEQFEPQGTVVRYAVSFGDGWMVYDGEGWAGVDEGDICAAGMDFNTIRAITSEKWGMVFEPGVFDIAVALSTAGNATPVVNRVDVYFLV